MKIVKKLMVHLRKTLGTERITLKIEGFDVPHAHVHLIPCNEAKDFWNKVRMDSPIDHPALQEMHKKLAL